MRQFPKRPCRRSYTRKYGLAKLSLLSKINRKCGQRDLAYGDSRKLWTGVIVQRITNALQKYSINYRNQHAYLPKRGASTANSQLFNTLETATGTRCPSHLIYYNGYWILTLPATRTPYALEQWDIGGLKGIKRI